MFFKSLEKFDNIYKCFDLEEEGDTTKHTKSTFLLSAAPYSTGLDNIEKTFVILSILSKPIDYGAADKKDVDLVCLVVSPSSSKSKHLYILSNFSRLLKNKNIAYQIRGCDNSDSLFAVLLNFNLSSAA